MAENQRLSDEEIKAKVALGQIPTRKIVTDVPTETIDLPSKGKYYDEENILATGKIELKYPTAKEEDILTSRNFIQKGTVIDEFISSLLVNPAVKGNDLLLGDKNAIIIASRIMAYGKEYPTEVTCPSCNEKNQLVIDISSIEPKESDFDIEKVTSNEFEFVLPASKKSVIFKVLTVGDDKNIDTQIKIERQKLKSKKSSTEITTRLRVALLSADGTTDRMEIKNFVDNMLSVDSLALRKEIARVTPDIDMRFEFTCDFCNVEERMMLPLGINFFWPSSSD